MLHTLCKAIVRLFFFLSTGVAKSEKVAKAASIKKYVDPRKNKTVLLQLYKNIVVRRRRRALTGRSDAQARVNPRGSGSKRRLRERHSSEQGPARLKEHEGRAKPGTAGATPSPATNGLRFLRLRAGAVGGRMQFASRGTAVW